MDQNASVSHQHAPMENPIEGIQAFARIEESDASPEGESDHEQASSANTANPELWSTTRKKRGRHPKDPHAEYIRFDCNDVDDMEQKLKDYLEAPSAPAEHATIEFHFPVSSAFMVYSRDYKRNPSTPWTAFDVPDVIRRTAVSVHDVMQPTEDPKEQIIRQKAVARICVEAIQRADGFRYSFHNNWLSREDKAHRFSFFCNDSTLNKGRAAGGGVKSGGKEARKPIYECQGLIAIKFSITKNNLEVHYRHVPLHRTYEERAPPPRRESKRYRLLELLNPDALHNMKLPRKKAKTHHPDGRVPKRGRARKSDSTLPDSTSERERDKTLQPLIDFLGSADRVESNGGVVAHDDDSNRAVHATGQIDLTSDDAGDRLQPALVFPAEKMRELQNTIGTTPKQQKKKAIQDFPGMLAGSFEAGNITWGNSETPVPKGDGRKKKDKANGKAKNQSREPLAGMAAAAAAPLSELEALKQKLIEAEQRIERLETEKRPSPPLPPAYPPYPPHPYQYPYPPPPQGYGYPPYPPPPPPPPPNPTQDNKRPALRIRHYSGPAGQEPPSQTSPRSSFPASSPAQSQPSSSAGPPPSPAQSRPPNSAGPAPLPATPHSAQPAPIPTQMDLSQPKSIGTAGVLVPSGSEPPRQYPPPVTPLSASQQQPSGGILKLVPNSSQMQTLEAAKMRNGPIGTSVISGNTPPTLRINAPKESSVHSLPVPAITSWSWAPVAVSNQGLQSAQSQWSKWRVPRTPGSGYSPVQQQSQSNTPVTATPVTARSTALETPHVHKDSLSATPPAPAPAAPTAVESEATSQAETEANTAIREKELLSGIAAAAAEKEPETEPRSAAKSGTDAPASAYASATDA